MPAISGSNWVPEHFLISSFTKSKGREFLYVLFDVIASNVSATAAILAISGISVPASPLG